MIELIKKVFGVGPKVNLGELIKNGALIIDVRSKGEFSGGHLKRSVNIPLDQLPVSYHKLSNKNKVIITCCASGMRSSRAKNLLKNQGYTEVYNGGSWNSLRKYCE